MVAYSNIGAQILEESGDVYILEKDTMHITHRHVLTQPYKYSLRGLQYKKVPIHEEEGKRQILPDSIIMKIGYLAKDIEKKLYFPQKIYWTMENGILYVTRLKQM
jgi:phosphoenolpyruvate synthase/pyruvate phosphate dikinase